MSPATIIRHATELPRLLVAALLALSQMSAAVEHDTLVPIRDSLNVVLKPCGRSRQSRIFYQKLDSVLLFETGRVNVVHLGGSHVQADIYTNVIRRHLDSLNGTLRPPRGLIFPFETAGTNNPANYRAWHTGRWQGARNAKRQFERPLGVAGIMASTADTTASVSISLNADSTRRWQATTLTVLGSSLHGGVRPRIVLGDTLTLRPDSTRLGFVFELGRPVDSFRMTLCFDSPDRPDTFCLRGFVPDNQEPGLVYHSIGVNGASVPSYLGCEYFERELALLRPDLFVMAVGINDATGPNFTDSLLCADYDSLIARIRRVAPDCALMFVSNNDSFHRVRRRRVVNPNGQVARRAFERLACKWQGGFWDLFEIMGGLGSVQRWRDLGLARPDRVHFTRAGYELVGRLFVEAFLNDYFDYDYEER